MPKQTKGQQQKVKRVMHEYKHGELKRGKGGKGGKVKSRKQAIAIAMNEAGTSKYQSPKQKRRAKGRSIKRASKKTPKR